MDENQLTVAEAQPPQQLITIEPAKYVELVFEPFAKRLADAKTLAEAAQFDVTTTAGMAVAVKHRATFRDIRVASEKARKERKAPILEIGKLLDSRQKEIEAEIEPFESLFDDAIKAEEARKEAEKQAKLAAEQARVAAIRSRIDVFRNAPAQMVGMPSQEIGVRADHLSESVISLDEFGELAGEATVERNHAVKRLREMQEAQRSHEAEQARIQAEREQLAKERAEAAERERVAAAQRAAQEKADREAREREEARLKAEREAAEARLRAEREAHEAALRKEREAEEARLRAAREAEEQRLAEQRAELARQQAAIDAANAERERVEREAREAAEREAARLAQEEADRVFAEQQRIAAEQAAEAARIEAERVAAEAERQRRERVQFEINGPGDVEIVKTLAAHYGVVIGDVMQWMKKFDYDAADEHFAAANVAANRLEKAA